MERIREMPWLAGTIRAIRRILAWEMSFLLGEQVWDFASPLADDGLIAAFDKQFQRLSEGSGRIVWGARWRSQRICLHAPDSIDLFQGGWPLLRRYVGAMYFRGRLEDKPEGKVLTGRFRHPAISRAFYLAFINGIMAWLVIAAATTAFSAFTCVLNGGEACKYALSGSIVLALGAPLSMLLLGVLRLICRLNGLHRKKSYELLAGIAEDAAN